MDTSAQPGLGELLLGLVPLSTPGDVFNLVMLVLGGLVLLSMLLSRRSEAFLGQRGTSSAAAGRHDNPHPAPPDVWGTGGGTPPAWPSRVSCDREDA